MHKIIRLKKGQILQKAGEFNTKTYVVESGLLRSYTICAKGKEHIFSFAPEEWIIADLCLPSEPCQLMIDALEDSVVQVHLKDPEISIANKNMLVKRMEMMQKRIISLIAVPSIERYDHFLKLYPKIVQRVPQRMIASYLGVTPEALSKAKSDRLKKDNDSPNPNP